MQRNIECYFLQMKDGKFFHLLSAEIPFLGHKVLNVTRLVHHCLSCRGQPIIVPRQGFSHLEQNVGRVWDFRTLRTTQSVVPSSSPCGNMCSLFPTCDTNTLLEPKRNTRWKMENDLFLLSFVQYLHTNEYEGEDWES